MISFIVLSLLSIDKTCVPPCSASIDFSVTVLESTIMVSELTEVEPNSGIFKLDVSMESNLNQYAKLQESYLVIDESKKLAQVAFIIIDSEKINCSFPESIIAFRWDENAAKTAVALYKRKEAQKVMLARANKKYRKAK